MAQIKPYSIQANQLLTCNLGAWYRRFVCKHEQQGLCLWWPFCGCKLSLPTLLVCVGKALSSDAEQRHEVYAMV